MSELTTKNFIKKMEEIDKKRTTFYSSSKLKETLEKEAKSLRKMQRNINYMQKKKKENMYKVPSTQDLILEIKNDINFEERHREYLKKKVLPKMKKRTKSEINLHKLKVGKKEELSFQPFLKERDSMNRLIESVLFIIQHSFFPVLSLHSEL